MDKGRDRRGDKIKTLAEYFVLTRMAAFVILSYTKKGDAVMLAIRLEATELARIDETAKNLGQSRSAFVREAIMRYMEDLEDAALADAALRAGGKPLTVEEARRELGLDA
jgi:RHH-type rel operon transcriptional repressor/antitoxin RelB